MFICSLRLSDSFFYANLFPFSPSTTHVMLYLSMRKEIVTPILTFIYIYIFFVFDNVTFQIQIQEKVLGLHVLEAHFNLVNDIYRC